MGQLATGGTRRSRRQAPAFHGWHEPCDRRRSSTDLGEARGEIPRAYSATGNRIQSNRIGGTRRKLRRTHREATVTAPYSYAASETLRRRFPQQSPGRAVKISV